jgi:hypothetical protein
VQRILELSFFVNNADRGLKSDFPLFFQPVSTGFPRFADLATSFMAWSLIRKNL